MSDPYAKGRFYLLRLVVRLRGVLMCFYYHSSDDEKSFNLEQTFLINFILSYCQHYPLLTQDSNTKSPSYPNQSHIIYLSIAI